MLEVQSDCLRCGAQLTREEVDCKGCGANRFDELQIRALEESAIKEARRWILGIGLWYVVSALILMAVAPAGSLDVTMLLGINVTLGASCVGLWWWAQWQPLRASIAAAILFGSGHLVNALFDPSSLRQGILIKVLCVVVLVRAIQAGREVSQIREKGRQRLAAQCGGTRLL